jgi:uncharacterized protein YndB with AHSA1/START domain
MSVMIHELIRDADEQHDATIELTHATWDVRASVAIHAEWRRILNALTVPEFMDVWLTMPGIERLECNPEQWSSGGFRIDAFVAGRPQRSIYGSCFRSRPDEISYLWEKAHSRSGANSLVTMRLRGGPRKCSVHLKHHGLCNQKERDWYSSMWQISLDKLRRVMERNKTKE